jgi:hypothetical protein
MSARNAVAAALLSAGLIVVAAPSAEAKPSAVSGIDIPFPIVDTTTGCASTGRLRMYPDVTPGLVATEKITAMVDSPACPSLSWNVWVGIIDNAPGFTVASTSGAGAGSASAEQTVLYANAPTPAPHPVRGAARVSIYTTWIGSNGVRGCVINDWVVASYLDAYEVGPVVPCDDRIKIVD